MDPKLKTTLKALIASGATATVIAGALMTHFEGRVYVPHKDPVGILTVCEGHTGWGIIQGKRYTDRECDNFKAADTALAKLAVDRQVKVPISPTIEAALIDFTINKGAGALSKSSILRKLNEGDYAGSCKAYALYTKARVKGVLTWFKGLFLRSEADQWVCEYSRGAQ